MLLKTLHVMAEELEATDSMLSTDKEECGQRPGEGLDYDKFSSNIVALFRNLV